MPGGTEPPVVTGTIPAQRLPPGTFVARQKTRNRKRGQHREPFLWAGRSVPHPTTPEIAAAVALSTARRRQIKSKLLSWFLSRIWLILRYGQLKRQKQSGLSTKAWGEKRLLGPKCGAFQPKRAPSLCTSWFYRIKLPDFTFRVYMLAFGLLRRRAQHVHTGISRIIIFFQATKKSGLSKDLKISEQKPQAFGTTYEHGH